MSHQPQRAPVDALTARRLLKLPSAETMGVHVIESFATFIDTHRDQPHVGVFFEDIHRGQCRPTPVSYAIEDDLLIDEVSGRSLQRHQKHMFVTNAYFSQFIVDHLMSTGNDPRDGNGCLPTSHFRNSRTVIDPTTGIASPPVYELKSFREVVRLLALEHGIR